MRTLLIVLLLGFAMTGCATPRHVRADHPIDVDQVNRELDRYALGLIFSIAPELRTESLERMEASWPHSMDGSFHPESGQFDARYRFSRDGRELYRFVRIHREARPAPQPAKVTLTIGKERAASTRITEEKRYVPRRPGPGQ